LLAEVHQEVAGDPQVDRPQDVDVGVLVRRDEEQRDVEHEAEGRDVGGLARAVEQAGGDDREGEGTDTPGW
jgi:hypothetical protein